MSTALIEESQPQDQESIWTSRNPTKPVIPMRVDSTRHLTDAEKATASERRAISCERSVVLHQAIDTCLAARKVEAEWLAKDHGWKTEYIECLLNASHPSTMHWFIRKASN